jgi:hypothetical protein
MKTRLPVRSALFKHDTGGLVVKWVTISESLLLYVFADNLPPHNGPRELRSFRPGQQIDLRGLALHPVRLWIVLSGDLVIFHGLRAPRNMPFT